MFALATVFPRLSLVKAETAYIYGLQGWYTSADTIQFWGDANTGAAITPTCEQWDEACAVDRGFGFRKIRGYDDQSCTAGYYSDTCYVHAAVCCYWFGACDSHPCQTPPCWQTEEECGTNCYCLSIWKVNAFNAAPGDNNDGCYEIELICDPDEECIDADSCETMISWYQP